MKKYVKRMSMTAKNIVLALLVSGCSVSSHPRPPVPDAQLCAEHTVVVRPAVAPETPYEFDAYSDCSAANDVAYGTVWCCPEK
jgi:hypothetical protein